MDKKTIGIIGGMGPAATLELYRLIIENTEASKDQEHIHVIIDSNTEIPDRTAFLLGKGETPLPFLVDSAKKLEKAGADFLIMPCNTAHFFVDEIRKEVNIPVLSIIEETVKYLEGEKEAIVLCTEGTKKGQVYSKCMEKHGIECIYPNQILQNEVNNIIYKGIKEGKTEYNVDLFNSELSKIDNVGNTKSILACTELPLAMTQYGLKGSFVNCLEILAKSAIEYAGYKCKY